jgi:hypothetical protein
LLSPEAWQRQRGTYQGQQQQHPVEPRGLRILKNPRPRRELLQRRGAQRFLKERHSIIKVASRLKLNRCCFHHNGVPRSHKIFIDKAFLEALCAKAEGEAVQLDPRAVNLRRPGTSRASIESWGRHRKSNFSLFFMIFLCFFL